MSKSDDGHYELVLGNRQLLSGFFVLIILFAIFLTLGYVLGRNSVVLTDTPEMASQQDAESVSPRAPVRSAIADSAKPSAAGGEVAEATTAGQASTSATPTSVATVPTTSTPTPRNSVDEAKTVTSTQPGPVATDKPAPPTEAQKILDSRVRVITPRKGDTFVQVAAIGRAEAELMAGQLQRRGYRVFITEVPGRDLFRVLVGPFETPAKLTETKAKLAAEGIESIVQRYQ